MEIEDVRSTYDHRSCITRYFGISHTALYVWFRAALSTSDIVDNKWKDKATDNDLPEDERLRQKPAIQWYIFQINRPRFVKNEMLSWHRQSTSRDFDVYDAWVGDHGSK